MNVNKALIEKFREGKATPEEIQAIREWAQDGSWPDVTEDEVIREAIWDKMRAEMHPGAPVVPIRTKNRTWLKAAAVGLLLLGTGAIAAFLLQQQGVKQLVISSSSLEKRKIVLPDHSVVFLGPASSLTFPEKFPADKREIILQGEASFEVAKDAHRPFTVISENIRTTALGTSFKVRAYPGAGKVDVSLSYGKVVVCGIQKGVTADSTYLNPGEAAVYNNSSKHISKTIAKEAPFNYKENVLYFHRANMQEVITKLGIFYGIHVNSNPALNDVEWQVSGEFNQETLDVVMRNIAFTCDISYKISHDTLTISPIQP
ncbi:FecR domain-containing protein [Chitinophaga sp. MM2321]|uniref:FecR family protein n=1 Tax=Chitinophaga sp. MM2321 TaxID=3137178 RepID=UPI0032D596BF